MTTKIKSLLITDSFNFNHFVSSLRWSQFVDELKEKVRFTICHLKFSTDNKKVNSCPVNVAKSFAGFNPHLKTTFLFLFFSIFFYFVLLIRMIYSLGKEKKVITTMPGQISPVIALLYSKIKDKKLILDIRDPFSDHYNFFNCTFFNFFWSSLIKKSDYIVFNSQSNLDSFEDKFSKEINSLTQLVFIPNGYTFFTKLAKFKKPANQLSISHFGSYNKQSNINHLLSQFDSSEISLTFNLIGKLGHRFVFDDSKYKVNIFKGTKDKNLLNKLAYLSDYLVVNLSKPQAISAKLSFYFGYNKPIIAYGNKEMISYIRKYNRGFGINEFDSINWEQINNCKEDFNLKEMESWSIKNTAKDFYELIYA